MWKTLRGYGLKSNLANNAGLRDLARKSDGHLFEDIGLSRDAFVNSTEEQMRNRYWWYQ
jgi:uncharacterized protein YjiS (DUF1127 family)